MDEREERAKRLKRLKQKRLISVLVIGNVVIIICFRSTVRSMVSR